MTGRNDVVVAVLAAAMLVLEDVVVLDASAVPVLNASVVLDGVKCWLTALESPPAQSAPHVTTLPSNFLAANAQQVEYMKSTPDVNWLLTELESPPQSEPPQVTTLPSDFLAAKAP